MINKKKTLALIVGVLCFTIFFLIQSNNTNKELFNDCRSDLSEKVEHLELCSSEINLLKNNISIMNSKLSFYENKQFGILALNNKRNLYLNLNFFEIEFVIISITFIISIILTIPVVLRIFTKKNEAKITQKIIRAIKQNPSILMFAILIWFIIKILFEK